jgi:hypothetical protein
MFSFLFRKRKCTIRCSASADVMFRDMLGRSCLQPSEASHLVISLPTEVCIIKLPRAREMWMCCCPKVECHLGAPICRPPSFSEWSPLRHFPPRSVKYDAYRLSVLHGDYICVKLQKPGQELPQSTLVEFHETGHCYINEGEYL